MAESYFVKKKVREFIKQKGCNTSKDLLTGDSLNTIIESSLDKAIKRATANGRKTVFPRDL